MSLRDNRLSGARKMGDLLGRQVRRNDLVGRADTVDIYQFTLAQAGDFSLESVCK